MYCELTLSWRTDFTGWLMIFTHTMVISIEKKKKEKKKEDVPLVEYMYLVFTRMPGESYRRRFRSSSANFNSLLCWFISVNSGHVRRATVGHYGAEQTTSSRSDSTAWFVIFTAHVEAGARWYRGSVILNVLCLGRVRSLTRREFEVLQRGRYSAERSLCYISSRLVLLTVILGGIFDRFLVFNVKSATKIKSGRNRSAQGIELRKRFVLFEHHRHFNTLNRTAFWP